MWTQLKNDNYYFRNEISAKKNILLRSNISAFVVKIITNFEQWKMFNNFGGGAKPTPQAPSTPNFFSSFACLFRRFFFYFMNWLRALVVAIAIARYSNYRPPCVPVTLIIVRYYLLSRHFDSYCLFALFTRRQCPWQLLPSSSTIVTVTV